MFRRHTIRPQGIRLSYWCVLVIMGYHSVVADAHAAIVVDRMPVARAMRPDGYMR